MPGRGTTVAVAALRASFAGALALAVALAGCDEGAATRVRFVHAYVVQGPVDLYVDGQPVASGIAFGDASGWLAARPGAAIDVRATDVTVIASGTVSSSGDHVAVLGEAIPGAPVSLAVARLPAAQHRGVELALVGGVQPFATEPGDRIAIPDRPGLVAQAEIDRAGLLVVPADTPLFEVGRPGATRRFALDDALRVAQRVVLTRVGSSRSVPSAAPSALVALDPDAPRAGATWIVPPLPRVHALSAVAGGSVTLRLDDEPLPALCVSGCVLPAAEVVGGTAELTVTLGARVLARRTLTVVPGDDVLEIVTGDVDGDPPISVIEVRARLGRARAGGVVGAIVHAAPSLGDLTLFALDFSAGYRELGRLAPGEAIEPPSDASLPALGIGPIGGVVRAQATLFGAGSTEGTIVVLTAASDDPLEATLVEIRPGDAWAATSSPMGSP